MKSCLSFRLLHPEGLELRSFLYFICNSPNPGGSVKISVNCEPFS